MCGALSWALSEDPAHPIPESAIDDGLVLTGIGYALVDGLAHVDPVVEQLVDVSLVDQLALLPSGILCSQFAHQFGCRADLDEPLKYHPNGRGLGFVDDQL